METSGKTQPLLAVPGQYSHPRFSPDGKRLALVVRSAGGDDIQVYDWQRDSMTQLTFNSRVGLAGLVALQSLTPETSSH